MVTTDGEALDLLAKWFQQNTSEDECWGDTSKFALLAAGLLVDSGRSIVRPADAPKPCACGQPASYQGFCDQCIVRIGKEAITTSTITAIHAAIGTCPLEEEDADYAPRVY